MSKILDLPDHSASETVSAMHELCLAIHPRAHMSIVLLDMDTGLGTTPLRWALRPEGYRHGGGETVLTGLAASYREVLRQAFHAWIDHQRATTAQPEEVQP